MPNENIYIDESSGKVTVNMDVILTKTVMRDDEKIRVQTTGHDYDFIATVENKTEKTILIVFDDESDYLPEFSVKADDKADDWVGLLANDEGYETLEAFVNGRFHIEGDV